MNGLEATRVIRSEAPECNVIIVTQNDATVAREQARSTRRQVGGPRHYLFHLTTLMGPANPGSPGVWALGTRVVSPRPYICIFLTDADI
jgi:hypothetical protein